MTSGRLCFIAAVTLALIAASGVSAQNTFCERYTGALFGNATSPSLQLALVNAVVTRAFVGEVMGGGTPAALNPVTGLYYQSNTASYFNGTLYPFINYLSTSESSTLGTLVAHLNQFFMLALGCRAGAAADPWAPVSLFSVHVKMGINAVTETSFVTQVAESLFSFGVPHGTGAATDDITYVADLMSQFNRYANSNAFEICGAPSCPLAMAMAEIDTTASHAFSVLVGTGAGTTTLSINVNDYVHFNLGSTDGFVQTSSATSTVATPGGLSSGTGIRSYVQQFTTAGTYYFYNAAATSNHLTVNVATPSASSSTGVAPSSASTVVAGAVAGVAVLAGAAVSYLL